MCNTNDIPIFQINPKQLFLHYINLEDYSQNNVFQSHKNTDI